MQKPSKNISIYACACAALCCIASPAVARLRHTRPYRRVHAIAKRPARPAVKPALASKPVQPHTSESWPAYDEIQLVVERHLMPIENGYFAPASPLTAGEFTAALKRLQKEYLWRGVTGLPAVAPAADPAQALTREQAVDLLVKAMLPADAAVTWTPQMLVSAVLDIGQTDPAYQKSAALAAEKLFLPNPLRPTDPADRAFGADLLARAFPWGTAVPHSGVFKDEIRKALSMHLFYDAHQFPDSEPVTMAVLARAILRARMYISPSVWTELPDLPFDSADHKPLTRAQAVAMVVRGLVPDYHFNSRLASMGAQIVDPDARVVYALTPQTYLAKFHDENKIPTPLMGPVAVGAYKGLLPNLSSEPGQMEPNSVATMGYAANLLARAVNKPGDYTGIILDMSKLKPLERAGGMWVLNAGDSTTDEPKPILIYPSSSHLPIGPFFAAPGAFAYYGDVQGAEIGRAGDNPLIIHPLDWARYDWSNFSGQPGLRRGGGTDVPLTNYPFVHGTPPLILLAPEDAQKMQDLDTTDLLLRTGKVALVQPDWSMTAMR
ncbi:MAG TPA: hypothetical protein VFJ58_26620 [Armatimonadota bacterium]|nr:hypothetical protein [Armatimonadota bacterium]